MMPCDFCSSNELERVYVVLPSRYDTQVVVCDRCGLVQSVPMKQKENAGRIVSTSSDASWGNVRHSKGLRLKPAIAVIESMLPFEDIARVLDIGSNRGDFIRWARQRNPRAQLTAIEPDGTIVDGYKDLANMQIHLDKLEKVVLPENHFDFVYCSHTLEHADSAAQMLHHLYRLMKPGGYLFMEVPNVDVLGSDDTVEEFFMDKHRYHFNRPLLCDYLKALGFEILYRNDSEDVFNITLLSIKAADMPLPRRFQPSDHALPDKNKRLIRAYVSRLEENRKTLKKVVAKLEPFLARQKVAFWGGGRIFDALVRYGGLDPQKLLCVIDKYLWPIVPKVHGIKIHRPEYLKMTQPDVIVILARSSLEEIAREIRLFGFRRTIIPFTDLLQEARGSDKT